MLKELGGKYKLCMIALPGSDQFIASIFYSYMCPDACSYMYVYICSCVFVCLLLFLPDIIFLLYH